MSVLLVVLIVLAAVAFFVPLRWLLVGVLLALAFKFHAQILPALKRAWRWASNFLRGRAPSAPRIPEPPLRPIDPPHPSDP